MSKEFIEFVESKNKGSYVGVKYTIDSLENLFNTLFKKLELSSISNINKFHSTLIYSSKVEKNITDEMKKNLNVKVQLDKFEIFRTQDEKNAIVILLKSDYLVKRHKELMDKHKFSYDYDEYKPHITLLYDANDTDVEKINNFKEELSKYELILDYEYYNELILDWQNK